ncbi:MAG: TonB family protein [Pseudomonadota bacterium]|nr:MAG: TonB family protein [Pseudomonadota bacterium]
MVAKFHVWRDTELPWSDSENERRFKNVLTATFIVFVLFGAAIPFLPVPEISREQREQIPPRLAKVIIEKKKAPPPPPPKPKEEPKKKEAKKEEPKKKEKKKPKKKTESARKKAARSGVMALSDDLADLRESFDVAALDNNKTLSKGAATERSSSSTQPVLSARAGSGSGGINTRSLSRATGDTKLADKSSSRVSSNIKSRSDSTAGRAVRKAGRSEEAISLVFDRNKGAIYSIYNRALRKDPSLQGKVVVKLTIDPSGKVTAASIVSSELNDPELERRLVSRIKLFNFGAKNVAPVTITYPIDFLPS